ncbi:MAG: 7-carboxy-7-deazaguanine synthase QueE [Bacteroidota bacterium]|nr:7-carboxy-7-deazaguanine synthase QueE [Bacteroidota bacterium]
MEMFYTVQGEGLYTGTPAFFVRLAGCDVGCAWCDVKESWKVEAEQYIFIHKIVENALQHPSKIVVITGGEPLMYDLSELLKAFHTAGFRTHIETSGAYELSGNADWICVSPKKFKSPLPSVLKKADELKVVIFHSSDYKWAESNAALVNPGCQLFLQPEFEKSSRLLPELVLYVKKHPQWRISLQTHKFIGIP